MNMLSSYVVSTLCPMLARARASRSRNAHYGESRSVFVKLSEVPIAAGKVSAREDLKPARAAPL
jgi:hypothetical protein